MIQKQSKYVDMKVNGRLFPSWLMANFKSYKLPEILKTDEDKCSGSGGAKKKLREIQLFISKFMDYNSPFHDILIYHGLGAGKTATTINVYNMLYNYTPGWNVFILLKATLKNHPWMSGLNEWLQDEEKSSRMDNITFVSYDAPNADKAFMEAIANSDSSKKFLFIVEEVHIFISNVYSNVTTKQGRRAQTIYDYIIQNKIENEGTRVICLSGTPVVNEPFELALLFNLLRPGSFPKSEALFEKEYVAVSAYSTLNPARKNNFQRRITGLISYYIGATPDYYATKIVDYIDVEMSPYQADIYGYFEKIEEKAEAKSRGRSGKTSSYKTYTRQACNFVFPQMTQDMTGELRPRPINFKLDMDKGESLDMAAADIDKTDKKYYDANNYMNAIDQFEQTFDDYLDKINTKDVAAKHTLKDDIAIFKDKYGGDFNKFKNADIKKSGVYEAMYSCSAKMLTIVFTIMKSPGPALVYSNYVLMEGLTILKIYLKHFGFTKFDPDSPDSGKDHFRYSEYHGGIAPVDRAKTLEHFNEKENRYGAISKIMMISPAGAEGLSLSNMRQVHLMEPYWQEVRMEQMIGRAIRFCSHKDLPRADRFVNVYRYKSVRHEGKRTADQYVESIARGKEGLLQSFLGAMKEAAIDCELFKSHNSLLGDYKCFQFTESSLFDTQIGPAYKEDWTDDLDMDNGSNSTTTQTVRTKAIKIVAVKQLSANPNDENFSKPQNYWYNPDTGTVYDFEMHYPIGKIAYDALHIPVKTKNNYFVIDKMIPIPMIDETN